MVQVKQVLKFLLFLSVGLVILYLIYSNQQSAYLEDCIQKGIPEPDCSLLSKIIKDFKSANWSYVFFAVLAYMLSCAIRAVRWNMLTKPIGYPISNINSFGAVMIGYLANMALPRVGEFARAGVISKYETIPTDKAFGTIITERAVDLILLISVVLLTLTLEFDKVVNYFSENENIFDSLNQLITPTYLIIIAGIILLLIYLFKVFKQKILNNFIVVKVKNLISGLKSGILSIKELERPLLFVFYSISIWALYYLMTYLAFKSFAPTESLGMQTALVVFVFGSLGVAFPSPGGMGSYHFLVMQALGLYGVDQADGFSFANIIFFSVNIGGNVVIGLLSLILLPLLNRQANDKG